MLQMLELAALRLLCKNNAELGAVLNNILTAIMSNLGLISNHLLIR